jgi:hypothetical protein
LCNVHVGIKVFVFEISFFLTVLGQSCMWINPTQVRWAYIL